MIFNLEQRCYIARSPYWALGCFDRLRGMIGRRFEPGKLDAMIFPRCRAVHSMGMSMTIDVVFVDKESQVAGLAAYYRPWRRPVFCCHADTVIELPAGTIAATGTEIGHLLNLNSNFTPETVEKLRNEAMVKTGFLPCAGENGEKA